jgi:predicted DNA-binding WGR domain protein
LTASLLFCVRQWHIALRENTADTPTIKRNTSMENDSGVAQVIELVGFDPEGEPELRVMHNGHLYVVFNFMPPSDCEDEDAYDSFDEEMAEALGVEVDWEDREVFMIQAPKADTIERLAAFVAAHRKNLGVRRFEMVEGNASKFWEVSVSDCALTVNFGRIGTAGQAKTKEFDEPAEARKERDKLIKEKTRKGYAEVDAAEAGA